MIFFFFGKHAGLSPPCRLLSAVGGPDDVHAWARGVVRDGHRPGGRVVCPPRAFNSRSIHRSRMFDHAPSCQVHDLGVGPFPRVHFHSSRVEAAALTDEAKKVYYT